jgi:3-deoxy-7-phosphoheptulonate synthase
LPSDLAPDEETETVTLQTDDLRIHSMQPLLTPENLLRECARTAEATATVLRARSRLQRILHGEDDRLAVVIGPCSIHDATAAREYAGRLAVQCARFADTLHIIMRVYFEKPRTTVGWKGLINDPHLDGSFRINEGLGLARQLLIDINHLGLPAGCEFLDIFTPQYLADLVSWGAIGARTTESQVHREMASGLSCPVGFKNGTDGNVRIAVDAVKAASQPHHFLAVMKNGRSAIASTSGNADCHVILRGGRAPNFDADSVESTARELLSAGCPARLMIDVSHGNSCKNPDNQPHVIDNVAAQVAGGSRRIAGVMVESHLVGGRQDIVAGQALRYGQSVTDGCIDWLTSVRVLETLSQAVTVRRERVGPLAPILPLSKPNEWVSNPSPPSH